jgi:hypothetical protein
MGRSYFGRLKPGKKTIAWEKKRAELKVLFEGWGVITCELKFVGCLINWALGFAHAKRRRNLKPDELGKVILACVHCHEILDCRKEHETEAIVNQVIANRVILKNKMLSCVI